ncbi:hypothetical protein [Streptomyces meridianus]|uniref:Secreted protein n=1 Tax=Streptomyces meridianus TaxID=2938945 RepID=A0ABT0X5L1_9ACTN|nr:hypothetical protein [Streptomyces meridianus]MCM2577827.1 hypothetical protein [Streptomyces meridianus]
MSRFRTAAVSAAVLASLLTAAGIATAAGDDATSSDEARKTAAASSRDGSRSLCKHAPRMDKRIARAVKRLNAGPARRGSVDRLEKRLERAKAAGHDEVANYLENRLKFRRTLVPTLEQRRKDLTKVEQWCRTERGGKEG